MKTLYLFDIDGTLVNINDIHLNAYKAAYKKICNQLVPDEIILRHFGMAEQEQQEAIFKIMNMPKERIPKLIREYVKNMKDLTTKTKITSLPGVIECLSALKKDKCNVLGIVTGNTEDMMHRILKSAGLHDFFSQFNGDDGNVQSRIDILKNAVRNLKPAPDKIIVIGDTQSDINAGKVVGAITIGITTGSNSKTDLETAHQNFVIRNLSELKILEKDLNRAKK